MTDEERIERLENKLKEALSWWRAAEKTPAKMQGNENKSKDNRKAQSRKRLSSCKAGKGGGAADNL